MEKLKLDTQKIKKQNKKLKEKTMTPAQLKEKRAKKQRAESYKLWSSELSRDIATGTTKFIWHSMEDKRVCSECWKMNGKVFNKSDAPKLRKFYRQHKGENGCRCYLEAVN